MKYWMVIKENGDIIAVSDKSPTNAVKKAKKVYQDDVSRPILCSKNLYDKFLGGELWNQWTMINDVAQLNSDINTDANCDEMRSLLDGAIDIVMIWNAESPSQKEWKKNWLEKAKKHGAEIS